MTRLQDPFGNPQPGACTPISSRLACTVPASKGQEELIAVFTGWNIYGKPHLSVQDAYQHRGNQLTLSEAPQTGFSAVIPKNGAYSQGDTFGEKNS